MYGASMWAAVITMFLSINAPVPHKYSFSYLTLEKGKS